MEKNTYEEKTEKIVLFTRIITVLLILLMIIFVIEKLGIVHLVYPYNKANEIPDKFIIDENYNEKEARLIVDQFNSLPENLQEKILDSVDFIKIVKFDDLTEEELNDAPLNRAQGSCVKKADAMYVYIEDNALYSATIYHELFHVIDRFTDDIYSTSKEWEILLDKKAKTFLLFDYNEENANYNSLSKEALANAFKYYCDKATLNHYIMKIFFPEIYRYTEKIYNMDI